MGRGGTGHAGKRCAAVSVIRIMKTIYHGFEAVENAGIPQCHEAGKIAMRLISVLFDGKTCKSLVLPRQSRSSVNDFADQAALFGDTGSGAGLVR